MNTKRKLVSATAVAALATTGVALAAGGHKTVIKDAKGDSTAPASDHSDITRVIAKRTKKTVSFTIKVVGNPKKSTNEIALVTNKSGKLVNGEFPDYTARQDYNGTKWALYKQKGAIGEKVASLKPKYRAHSVSVSFKLKKIHKPKKIKIFAYSEDPTNNSNDRAPNSGLKKLK